MYRFNGSQWQQEAELSPGDGAANYGFGNVVSMSERVIAVGANDDYFRSFPRSGLVYSYRLNDANWEEEVKLAMIYIHEFGLIAVLYIQRLGLTLLSGAEAGYICITNLRGAIVLESMVKLKVGKPPR